MAGDYDFQITGFKVSGFKKLSRLIEHLPEAARKAELEPLLVEGLEPMAEFARVMAPDDPLTGPPWDLPSSIAVSTRQRTGRAKSDRALGRFDARAYMGPTKFGYPQAIMREFGTIYQTAWPYMRPAYDSQKEVTMRIITEGFGKRVHMIVQKYSWKG